MKILISGKITGLDFGQVVRKFLQAERALICAGHDVINPVTIGRGLQGGGWHHGDYMHLTLAAVELCDAIYMLDDWEDSPGARMEHDKAVALGKRIIYEGEGPML